VHISEELQKLSPGIGSFLHCITASKMRLESLVTCSVLTVSFLAPLCAAGPLILAFPAIGAVFGIVPSTCFFGGLYVANAALLAGWQIGTGIFIGSALAGGAAAGGVAAGEAANDKAAAESSASVASVASVSVASVESVSKVSVSSRLASWSSDFSDVQKSSVAAVASAEALAEGAKAAAWSSHDPKYDVYTFSKRDVPTSAPLPAATDPAQIVTTGTAPPPPGTPVAPLPPGYTPPGLPPGVPQYNFDMCMNDVISMATNQQGITMGQPEADSK